MNYKEYKQLDLTQIGTDVRHFWEEKAIFEKGQKLTEGHPSFVFYDGPPSANGKPGIHHVMARTIKDVFCRYKAQKGFRVDRKAGWDTHGLPVELGVEKNLGITKEDIGVKISVDDYNAACRSEVLKYKDLWDELTRQMGYWVDLQHPYITFENEYIETLWFLLKKLYDKGLLYKGYTIQPFSPAAGTGLSSHELNLPGCYRDVKDTTCVAMFKIKSASEEQVSTAFQHVSPASGVATYAIAWTTTPWTLPSNTALCVGPAIDYVLLETSHPYTSELCRIIMAKPLMKDFFTRYDPKAEEEPAEEPVIEEPAAEEPAVSTIPTSSWIFTGEDWSAIIGQPSSKDYYNERSIIVSFDAEAGTIIYSEADPATGDVTFTGDGTYTDNGSVLDVKVKIRSGEMAFSIGYVMDGDTITIDSGLATGTFTRAE